MKKSVWIFVVVMLLSLCMAAFSACNVGEDSGNTKPDSQTNSESYRESNISGDDKESERVSETQSESESDKTSESESGETSESESKSESESESKSESGEESVHTHKFERNADERYLKSSATCEKRAEYYFSCKCGEMGMQTFEYGDLLPHTEAIDAEIKATCISAGLSAGKHCSVCNKVLEAQIAIPALGHDLAMHEGKASTCTEKGYAAYETCRRCDYTTYRELPLAEHELENGICKNCGKEITPHTHIEVIDEGKPATCLESGLTSGKHCSVCNKILKEQQVIPALGHDKISHNGKAATCTEAGYEAYETCSRCGYTTYTVIPALGHDYVPHDGKAATCLEDGYKTYMTCTRCDYTTYEVVSALGHILTHYNGKAATCTEAGYEAYDECSRCGYTTYKKIDALGHDIVSHEAKAATCTEAGYESYETCSRCSYSTYEEIPALGHDYKNGECTRCGKKADTHVHNPVLTEEKAATCTENGFKKYVCSECGTVTVDEIPALGHDLVLQNAKAPTCTEDGCEVYEFCSRCDYTTDKVVIPALGHDTVSHQGRAATCNESGWAGYETCSRCSYTTYKTLPALGHNYVDGKCTRCGAGDGATYSREGNYVYFGSYPQTKVSDETLLNTLNAKAGELPTEENSYLWNSYGYYVSGYVKDYMWYIDDEVDGSKYRGVYFTSYRPFPCDDGSYSTFQDDNGYFERTTYWFKYEGIKWRVLTESGNRAFLMCDIAIDAQQYYHDEYGTRTIDGKMVYSNNYAESEIRKWLNETFYNTAFNDLQKSIIRTTSVDNSARSTSPYNELWNKGENEYACENTLDKVFLLSEYEVTNPDYGFSESTSWDETRQLKSSDYAKSQGCWQDTDENSIYKGNCSWRLRSPSYDCNSDARNVSNYGKRSYGSVDRTGSGVVPALWIAL